MSADPTNNSEAFVHELCKRSFLSLWCYNNPISELGAQRKELCDILVVCDPHILIISVKDIPLKITENMSVSAERWERRAVDGSVKQIYGAERWLMTASHIIRADGNLGLILPNIKNRKIYRIAVAFGGKGQVLIQSGDYGKGFVHVLNEQEALLVMQELDTVSDFINYLAAKEQFVGTNRAVISMGAEGSLLGLYISSGRRFPEEGDCLIVHDGLWEQLCKKPEFQTRKNADRESYIWDRLIDSLADTNSRALNEAGADLNNVERALRVMAYESRFSRRMLGRGLREFLQKAKTDELRSRILTGNSNTLYVFVHYHADDDDNIMQEELKLRCLVARYIMGKGDIVIGVGIRAFIPNIGTATTLVCMECRHWNNEDNEMAKQVQADLGYYCHKKMRSVHDVEFPSE